MIFERSKRGLICRGNPNDGPHLYIDHAIVSIRGHQTGARVETPTHITECNIKTAFDGRGYWKYEASWRTAPKRA